MSKGSTQRPHDHNKFSENFDTIFGTKEKPKKKKKKSTK